MNVLEFVYLFPCLEHGDIPGWPLSEKHPRIPFFLLLSRTCSEMTWGSGGIKILEKNTYWTFTADVDNTENELFENAHFTMEEKIYLDWNSSPQVSHFIGQNKISGQSCFVMPYQCTTHQQNALYWTMKDV